MTISSSQHGVRLKHSKSSPSFVFCYLKKPKLIDSILILEFLSYQTNYFDKIYWIQTAQKNVRRAIWTIYNGQQTFRNIFWSYLIYPYQISIINAVIFHDNQIEYFIQNIRTRLNYDIALLYVLWLPCNYRNYVYRNAENGSQNNDVSCKIRHR